MYQIRKKIRFEMAHILDSSYSEECQQIHGHSYIAEIFLQAERLNADGMVLDFKKLKETINTEVMAIFDHALIVSENWYNSKKAYLRLKGVTRVPYNPTAENMAKDIFERLFSVHMQVCKVRLHETESGWAEYYQPALIKTDRKEHRSHTQFGGK